MAFLKCIDPNNAGNFLVMEDANIGIYRTVAGASRLFTPLSNIDSVKIQSGSTGVTQGRFMETPKIFVQTESIKSYSAALHRMNQRVIITPPTVTSLGNGQYRVGTSGGIQSPSVSNFFYPLTDRVLRQYRTNENILWGPYAVPGATSVSVGVYCNTYYYDRSDHPGTTGAAWVYRTMNVSVKVGLSATPTGAISWGPVAGGDYRQYTPFNIVASITGGGGSYFFINVVATNKPTPEWSTNPNVSPPSLSSFQAIGALVSSENTLFESTGNFNCVVVGK